MKHRLRLIMTGAIMAMQGVAALPLKAQEFNCAVEIDASSLEGTSKEIFSELKDKISDYINTTRWTNFTWAPHEKISSRLFLTIREISGDRLSGDLQLQMIRPVYNSTYTSTVINIKDPRVEFDFALGDRLDYNENISDGNLASLIDYYVWVMLAMDADTFSPKGGQEWWDRAGGVVQSSQSSVFPGWRMFGDNHTRGSFFRSMTEPTGSVARDALYKYHRQGLDEMSSNPEKGRTGIWEAIAQLAKIYERNPMSESLTMWRDAKLDEIVSVMSEATQEERKKVVRLLEPIWGADGNRLEKILNP